MPEPVDRQRRLILGTAISGVAAMEFTLIKPASAQAGQTTSLPRAPSSRRLEPL